MKKIIHGVMFSVMTLTSSCSNASSNEDGVKFWENSISSFNSGDINRAISSAKTLKKSNDTAAEFLLTQYKIYDGMEHPGSLGNQSPFSNMAATITNQASSYVRLSDVNHLRGEYIASKTFSVWRVGGKEKAMELLSSECAEWKQIPLNTCAGLISRDATAKYMASRHRMDAVYLYESLQIGWLAKALSYPDMSFGTALSLTDADPAKSRYILEKMDSDKILSANMKTYYCKFSTGKENEEKIINC